MRWATERSRPEAVQIERQNNSVPFQRMRESETTGICRTRPEAAQQFVATAAHLQVFRAQISWNPACTCFCEMDPLTGIAASGLRARMESLELLANNVANAATGGYKADREFYGLYPAAESDGSSSMPLIERPWIDLSQGLIRSTENPLDLAISGRGFFGVNGPNGPLYTRNGNFRLSPDGQVVTSEGYPVRGADGAPIVLQP